jgi:hypothetical protein
MARFYANENFPRRTVEVLAFATRASRSVLTLNRRDFIRLHKRGISHTGLIVCTEDMDTAAQAARVHDAVASLPSLADQLVRVNQPSKK